MDTPGNQATHRVDVQLRPLAENDISAVVTLWYQTWHHTFADLSHPQPLPVWEKRFRDDLACQGTVWVAEADQDIVGFTRGVNKINGQPTIAYRWQP